MNPYVDLKALERKAWTAYFEDGLWDIFIGLMMFFGGIRGLTDQAWITLLILPAVLASLLGKRYLTIPRIGLVKFGRKRQARNRWLTAVVVMSVVCTSGLVFVMSTGVAFPAVPLSPIIALWVASLTALMAWSLHYWRLLAYGLVYAIAEIIWGLFGSLAGSTVFTVAGGLVFLYGLILLFRFLRDYSQIQDVSDYAHP